MRYLRYMRYLRLASLFLLSALISACNMQMQMQGFATTGDTRLGNQFCSPQNSIVESLLSVTCD